VLQLKGFWSLNRPSVSKRHFELPNYDALGYYYFVNILYINEARVTRVYCVLLQLSLPLPYGHHLLTLVCLRWWFTILINISTALIRLISHFLAIPSRRDSMITVAWMNVGVPPVISRARNLSWFHQSFICRRRDANLGVCQSQSYTSLQSRCSSDTSGADMLRAKRTR